MRNVGIAADDRSGRHDHRRRGREGLGRRRSEQGGRQVLEGEPLGRGLCLRRDLRPRRARAQLRQAAQAHALGLLRRAGHRRWLRERRGILEDERILQDQRRHLRRVGEAGFQLGRRPHDEGPVLRQDQHRLVDDELRLGEGTGGRRGRAVVGRQRGDRALELREQLRIGCRGDWRRLVHHHRLRHEDGDRLGPTHDRRRGLLHDRRSRVIEHRRRGLGNDDWLGFAEHGRLGRGDHRLRLAQGDGLRRRARALETGGGLAAGDADDGPGLARRCRWPLARPQGVHRRVDRRLVEELLQLEARRAGGGGTVERDHVLAPGPSGIRGRRLDARGGLGRGRRRGAPQLEDRLEERAGRAVDLEHAEFHAVDLGEAELLDLALERIGHPLDHEHQPRRPLIGNHAARIEPLERLGILAGPGVGLDRLEQQAADEVELDRQADAAVEAEAGNEAGVGEEVVRLLDVAVDEHVLPRHEHAVEDEDRVVLVEPAGQRIVERAAHHLGRHLIGRAADQLHPRRVH